MLIKQPKTLQVGGHVYQIIAVPAMADIASVTHRLQKILVNLESPNSKRTEGLLHEILHIVNSVYCGSSLAEGDIDSLSEGLFQVLIQLVPDLEIEWEVSNG